MKKKLAMLLSAVMVLSPLTVFGATDNKLTGNVTQVVGKTLFFENGATTAGMKNLKADNDHTDDIEYLVNGTTMEMKVLNDEIKSGDIFKVTLDNAKWFFRNHGTEDVADFAEILLALEPYVKGVQITSVTPTVGVGALPNTVAKYGYKVVWDESITPKLSAEFLNEVEALVHALNSVAVETALEALDTNLATPGTPATATANGVSALAVGDIIALGEMPASAVAADSGAIGTAITAVKTAALAQQAFKHKEATSDFSNGDLVASARAYATGAGFSDVSTYKKSLVAATPFNDNGVYFPNSKTYIRIANLAGTIQPLYTLTVSNTDESVATVTMLNATPLDRLGGAVTNQNTNEGDILRVPIVSLSKGEGDIRVRVAADSNTSSITSDSQQFGQASKNSTTTTVKTQVTSKYTFKIDELRIKENVPASIRQGGIIITAPYGYTFADPNKSYKEDDKEKYVTAYSNEGDMFFKGNTTEAAANKVKFMGYVQEMVNGKSVEQKDKIFIDTEALGLITSSKTTGLLLIKGLQVIANDYASMDEDVILEIRNRDDEVYFEKDFSNPSISKENVKIGHRKDWGVELVRIGDIPTLVNGRYTEATKGTEFDKDHKAAKVKFNENVVASWWGLRESEFTLTEGAKFRKAKFSEVKNIEEKIDDIDYTPQAENYAHVKMDANRIKIMDVQIAREKTASFEIETWISIESGVEGDIELKAGGNDILTNETKPVVIAKAVSPITIESKVTDVKIGYQWQKAYDVVIKEKAPGYIKRDTTLLLQIDDFITGSDRIAFAPDFVTETNGTVSKIEISKPVVTDGTIQVEIERISNGKAAELTFSNMYVKIDRTVPESNKRPYDIIASGTAIAANYYRVADEKAKLGNYEAKFTTKGIGTEYLNVVTSANDKDSILSNVVRVEIGSNVIKIGRDGSEETEMDTAAYISTETNSTMVPVRFVSMALGIPENQIHWDDEGRKVTILNGSRTVQFEIGNSEININGVSKTMYSPDVPPIKVVPEIKDERAFLPFRELGNAFGVDVDWDEDTKTAIYNKHLLGEVETPEAEEK